MPGELEKICAMLGEGTAELQCAAAMVLGELKPKDVVVRKALVKALKSDNDSIRLYCVEALSRIDAEEALPHLVPLLSGPEQIRSRVTQILAALGPAAAKALRDYLGKGDAEGRKAALDVLGRLKEVDTTDALFAGLLDSDLEVVKKAAQAYRQRIGTMSEAEKGKALKKALEFMGSPRVQKAKTPLASCLLIVGAMRDPSAVKAVLPYVERKHPPAARNAALLALGSLPIEGPAGRAVASKLLPLLHEDDFNEIVKPALDVLWKIPPSRDDADRVFKLVKSEHPAVKNYAVRALGTIGTAPAAEALLEALWSPDSHLSDAAAGALRSNPDFVPALVKTLGREKDAQRAWRLAGLLRTYRNVLDKGTVRGFISKCLAGVEKKDGGFQVYFEIARALAPEALREALIKKGRPLLAKKPERAERYLRLLERDDLATAESDYALAIAQLHLQRKDLAQAGLDRGHALSLFSKLVRREGFHLLKNLEKDARLVSAEGLLYLGFALSERQGAEREAGAGALKIVAKKFGSSSEGKIARQKLKTQGML